MYRLIIPASGSLWVMTMTVTPKLSVMAVVCVFVDFVVL